MVASSALDEVSFCFAVQANNDTVVISNNAICFIGIGLSEAARYNITFKNKFIFKSNQGYFSYIIVIYKLKVDRKQLNLSASLHQKIE
jgi:hypothetical protein